MQPPRYGFTNLVYKIFYAIIEVIISLHVYQYINLYHSILINLFLYLQLLSIIPFFMYFNTTDILETNPDGPCSSDEFIFNFVLFLKFILISLIFSNYKCFSYELLFYYLCWKVSFSIRTKKLHNWIINEYYREKYHKYFEEYFIFVILLYFLNLMYLFRLSSNIFIIPIVIECFITMPSRLFKKETDTVPLLFPIKRYDIIKSKYKNIKLSNISFYSFLYLLFWQVQVDLKSAIFLSIFISLIILRIDSRYRKYYQISFLRYYSGIIYKFLLCIGFFLLLKNTDFLNENINKTDLITILIPLLVFNMGAFFILLQFNYQKYSSSYLIKTLINPFIVLMTIIFPAIVLCTTCFFSDNFFYQHSYLCYFFIVYTILSSFVLILYFSFISESWILLNTLLASTKWIDFESHRDSIFHLNESRIEAIQSIISSDIKANSVNVIRTDLLAMSDWTNINIGNIAYKSSMYRDIIDNRFTDFYNSIISEIFIKNNSAVADLFFRYFYYRCLNNVTYKNFKDYSIIFDIMFNFIKEQIDIDEKEAKRNLSLLLTRCPYILKKLDRYDELDIEKHITNNLKNIFDYAIKEHKDTFIKKNICLSDFFMNIDSERNYIEIEIDENLVDLYNEIRSILRELIETSSCEYNYIDTCVKELSDLSKFLIKLDTANINVSHLWDYHLFTCEQVIKKAQEISYIKNTGIFTPFYEILRETNDQIFENTLFLLLKLLDDFFYYLESTNNKEIMIAYWYEMNNLYSFYADDYEKQKIIKSFMDSITKKHCYLESYKSKMQSFHSNFTRIEGFNYFKLDIRK